MQYNAAGLLKEDIGARRNFAFENEEITTPGENFRAVAGVVKLLRTDKGILAQAEVHGLTHDLCSRCLGVAKVEIEAYLEEEFYPKNYFEGFTARDGAAARTSMIRRCSSMMTTSSTCVSLCGKP